MNADEVDLDLLADYVGGALDGTPTEARIADLVDTDPAWAAAYADLAAGMAAVATQLRGLGAVPMPDDVAERLSVALTSIHHAPAQAERHLHAVPPSVSRPARARRSRRWAMPVSVAAGVLAFAGFGATQLFDQSANEDATSAPGAAPGIMSAEASPEAQSQVYAAPALPDETRITASGQDYRPDSLGRRAVASTAGKTRTEVEPPADDTQVVPAGQVDPALRQLVPRTALVACLEAITAEHGGTIGPESVEYARYQGAPALVVRFTSASGVWVWVSGPGCGASGAATVTSMKVG